MKYLLLPITLLILSTSAYSYPLNPLEQAVSARYIREMYNTPTIQDSYRMDACLERLDRLVGEGGMRADEINRRINSCTEEATIPLEQWKREMEQRYSK